MNNSKINKFIRNRPKFLIFVVFCTIYNCVTNILSNLFQLLQGRVADDLIDEQKVKFIKDFEYIKSSSPDSFDALVKVFDLTYYINDKYQIYTILSMIIFGLGFYSAFLVLKGIRKGIHLYIGYTLLSILVIYSVAPLSEVPEVYIFSNFIFSGILIFVYKRFDKYMIQ